MNSVARWPQLAPVILYAVLLSKCCVVIMTSYGVDRYHEDCDAEECIHEVIGECLNNVNKAIDKKFIASIEIPIAADIAMAKLMNILNIATMKHDGTVTPGEPLEKIMPEKEPVPCLIDNWARGTSM